jgi:hypothetical protein
VTLYNGKLMKTKFATYIFMMRKTDIRALLKRSSYIVHDKREGHVNTRCSLKGLSVLHSFGDDFQRHILEIAT